MNYEQKYKSALGWMRSIYPTMQGADKEDAEHYFPELSESEDEKIRKGLIKGLSAMRDIHKHQTFSDDAINIDDAIAWLEKQGEQHYWSEEDEKMIEDIIEAIDTQYAVSDYNEMVSWLKSLKPQNRWKPTEEQLGALKYFISFHEDHARSLTTKWEEFKNLESLYNDLKSL